MVYGEERLYLYEYPDNPPGFMEVFLRYMGKEKNGIKMKGNLPRIWTVTADEVLGPLLFDDDTVYEVSAVDYDNNFIWLNRVFYD